MEIQNNLIQNDIQYPLDIIYPIQLAPGQQATLPNGIVIVNTTNEVISINGLQALGNGQFRVLISGSNWNIAQALNPNTAYDLKANALNHWLQAISNQEEIAGTSPRALNNLANFV